MVLVVAAQRQFLIIAGKNYSMRMLVVEVLSSLLPLMILSTRLGVAVVRVAVWVAMYLVVT
jgi:hypothetical protein